jgi:transposase
MMERRPLGDLSGKLSDQFSGGTAMEVVYPRWSGFDVHKRFVVACLSIVEQGQRRKELRQVSTMTSDILALKAWLQACGCRQIAMEATGVFWKPIYHLLEDSFEMVLVNAQHMRSSAWKKNRCQRCRMAGRFAATRLAQSQFHSRASSNKRCVISRGHACA